MAVGGIGAIVAQAPTVLYLIAMPETAPTGLDAGAPAEAIDDPAAQT